MGKKTKEKHILPSSDEAAEYRTIIVGWVDRTGLYWGEDEQAARWHGATHFECYKCKTIIPKNGYTECVDCREKKAIANYNARPTMQWSGKIPLYSEAIDEYYFDYESLEARLEDDDGYTIESLRLVICKPVQLRQLTEDYWEDDLSDDSYGELPAEVWKALEALNKVIAKQDPVSWLPGKYAALIDGGGAEGVAGER